MDLLPPPPGYACSCGNRRDKVALRTTCIKNVKFKIIKPRTGCQHEGYFHHSENLNWATQNPQLGHRRLDIPGPNYAASQATGLDIAELD